MQYDDASVSSTASRRRTFEVIRPVSERDSKLERSSNTQTQRLVRDVATLRKPYGDEGCPLRWQQHSEQKPSFLTLREGQTAAAREWLAFYLRIETNTLPPQRSCENIARDRETEKADPDFCRHH